MNKKSQVRIMITLFTLFILLIGVVFAVSYIDRLRELEDEEPPEPVERYFSPKVYDCVGIESVKEKTGYSISCKVTNEGTIKGDVLLEMGVIPKDTFSKWFGALTLTFAPLATTSTTSCCVGNVNIADIWIRDLEPGEEIPISVTVKAPWGSWCILGVCFDKISDKCKRNVFWVGNGNKYVGFAHLVSKCWVENDPTYKSYNTPSSWEGTLWGVNIVE